MHNTKYIIVLFLLSLASCQNPEEKSSASNVDLSELIYDSTSKTLSINFDKIKNLDIDKIELITKKNFQYYIFLDSNKQITDLYNAISLDNKKSFINNTWYNFDKQGNLYKPLSFFYDTYMRQNKDKDSSFITYDALFNLHGGEHYAIVGDYNEYFELPPNSKVDTFWMRSDEPVIMIPVDAINMKEGKHNIRFVVYEDKRVNDTITRNRTFVDRDYFIKHDDK